MSQLPSSPSAPDVVAFCHRFQLNDTPVFLTHRDEGYGPDWCQVSAKHHAMTLDGKRVHGWALWQYPTGVMGEFHSVWEMPDGMLVDVTPPKFGHSQVLFVRDRAIDIYVINNVFALATDRMSPPNPPYWWQGNPTNDTVWGMPPGNPHLIHYCASLGFPIAELETNAPFG